MVKKHIRHFNRGMIIGFEFLGLLAFTVFVGWLVLIARLSQGPMNVDFLSDRIEQGLGLEQSGMEFSVNSTTLTWGGRSQPFEFEVRGVQIFRSDKTPVLSIDKIGIQLSKKYLVFGKFVPRVIKIYSPALRVIRNEDGGYLLNMRQADVEAAAAIGHAEQKSGVDITASQTEFLNSLIQQMRETGTFDLLSRLEQIVISNAALLYEDKLMNVKWQSRNSDVVFTRRRGNLMVDAIANMEMGAEQKAYVRASFYYSWQTKRPNGVIYFTGINPSLIAQQSEQLKDLAGVDLPLKGSVAVDMDEQFKIAHGRFVFGADAGTFNALELYKEPAKIKSFYTQGYFNAVTREAKVDQLRLDLDGPKLNAKISVRKTDEGNVIDVAGLLLEMPMDSLKNYWPEKLAADPRAWVTQHLSAGIAHKATLALTMLAPQGDFKNLKLQNVGGDIGFTGIKVDYFPPLMPVTKVNGKASYDHKSFTLDMTSGTLGDMSVTKSHIDITDLDIQSETVHSKIDISVSLNGPLKTALKVLDSKPLEYPKMLKIKTADVAGTAAVDVNFKFPLLVDLKLDDVKVAAHAKINNAHLKDVVPGFDLDTGPVELALDNGALSVKGKGKLDAMPVTFDWLRRFGKADVLAKLEAKLPLDAPSLLKFGMPADFKPQGTIPADITYTIAKDNTAILNLKGDITAAGFTVPLVGYEKKAGAAGTIDMLMKLNADGKLSQIADLNLISQDAVAKGSLAFDPTGRELRKVALTQMKMGATDVAINVDYNSGYAVKVTGKQFDASSLLSDKKEDNSDEEAAKQVMPMTVSMAVDRLITGENKFIEKIKMYMRRNGWNRIDQLDVDGVSGGKPLMLHYTPIPQGHTLRFQADNAGAALSALGITSAVRDGVIYVNGTSTPKGGPRDMQGTIAVNNFTVVNAPVLARLLNAMSLAGLSDLLGGKGISFKKLRADFFWVDKGQPETAKNVRLIRLKNGETAGSSLGLTFEGTIDNWSHILDLSGTIIPVSDINKLVGVIPLVGQILTGGGKGVFAATYSIKGPKKEPTVKVNPLAVLAPGILRKMFFEK